MIVLNSVSDIPLYISDSKNLIVLEENSQAVLIEIRRQNSDSGDMHTNTNIKIGKNATLSYFFIQHATTNTRNQAQFSIDLQAPQAACTFQSLTLGSHNTHSDLQLSVQHHQPGCSTQIVSRGVFKDNAKGNFIGKIVVHPYSRKTKAFLDDKNLLLSKTAAAHTRPQLEIYNGDIQCSHGATVGELDLDALFYLQSRGLEKSLAEQLLIQAFIYPSLQGISATALPYIEDLIHEY